MIAVRVQHHESRRHLLPGLLWKLEPLPVEVIEHHSAPPSPWAGYQRCMADPPDCSHLLVIQDDAMPCEGFVPALEQIAAHTDTPVCLFLAALPADAARLAKTAYQLERRYITLPYRGFMPVVAVLWPLMRLREFALWSEEHPTLPGQREPRSDDAMAGMWKIRTRQTVRATVPSIVEHPDNLPSLITPRGGRGQDKGRRALYLADDASDYDWTSV